MKKLLSLFFILACGLGHAETSSALVDCASLTSRFSSSDNDQKVDQCFNQNEAQNLKECLSASSYYTDTANHDRRILACRQQFGEKENMGACVETANRIYSYERMSDMIKECGQKYNVSSLMECQELAQSITFEEHQQILASGCLEQLKDKIDLETCRKHQGNRFWKDNMEFHALCGKRAASELSFKDCLQHAEELKSDNGHDLTIYECLKKNSSLSINSCMDYIKTFRISMNKLGGINFCANLKPGKPTAAATPAPTPAPRPVQSKVPQTKVPVAVVVKEPTPQNKVPQVKVTPVPTPTPVELTPNFNNDDHDNDDDKDEGDGKEEEEKTPSEKEIGPASAHK